MSAEHHLASLSQIDKMVVAACVCGHVERGYLVAGHTDHNIEAVAACMGWMVEHIEMEASERERLMG